VKDGDENIHTANERRLTEITDVTGGKLHTGREGGREGGFRKIGKRGIGKGLCVLKDAVDGSPLYPSPWSVSIASQEKTNAFSSPLPPLALFTLASKYIGVCFGEGKKGSGGGLPQVSGCKGNLIRS